MSTQCTCTWVHNEIEGVEPMLLLETPSITCPFHFAVD